MAKEVKKVKIFDDYEVEFNEQLLDDFDFVTDLNSAINSNDLSTLVTMTMALVGGDATWKEVRRRITEEYGYLSNKAVEEVLSRISAQIPKAGAGA